MPQYPNSSGTLWILLCLLLMTGQIRAEESNDCTQEFLPLPDLCIEEGSNDAEIIAIIYGTASERNQWRNLRILDSNGDTVLDTVAQYNSYGHFIHRLPIRLGAMGAYTAVFQCSADQRISTEFNIGYAPAYQLTVESPSCPGEIDASIQLTPSKLGGLTYEWSDGRFNERRDQLSPGNYRVSITSSTGCTTVENINITDPEPISLTFDVKIYDCKGAMDSLAFVAISGGTPPYQVDWSNDGTNDFDDGSMLVNAPEGILEVRVRDASNCEQLFNVQVLYPNSVDPFLKKSTLLTPIKTIGNDFVYNLKQSLDITMGDIDNDGANGSIFKVSFHESKGSADQDIGAMPTDYVTSSAQMVFARVESYNGCYVISEIELINEYFCIPNSEACDNSDPFILNPTLCDSIPTPLPAGGTYEAFQVFPGDVLVPSPSLISCNGLGECLLDPTDAAGNYEIHYTYSEAGRTITRIALFDIQAVFPQIRIGFDSICANSPIFRLRMNPAGGIFRGPAIVDSSTSGENQFYYVDPSLLSQGTWNRYTYYYSNLNRSGLICEKTAVDSLFAQLPVYVNVAAVNIEACSLATVTFLAVNARGPIQRIEWTDPNGNLIGTGVSTQFRVTEPGRYQVKAIGSNGCVDSADVLVDILSLPELVCDISAAVSCPGGADAVASLEIVGVADLTGYDVSWSNGGTGLIQTGLSAGTYSVTVTAPNGCSDSCNAIITEPNVLEIECQHVIQPVTCNGGLDGIDSVHVTGGTPPYRYSLNGGPFQTSPILMNVPGGQQVAYILDANDCLDSCFFSMPEPPTFSCASSVMSQVGCNGESTGQLEVTPIGGNPPYRVQWNTGSTDRILSNLPAGTYTVEITDSKDCFCSEQITLVDPPLLEVFVENDTLDCNGDNDGILNAQIQGGRPPYRILWSNNNTNSSNTNLTAGSYNVQVLDRSNCSAMAMAEIIEPTPLMVDCQDGLLDCHGAMDGTLTVIPSGGTPPYQYLWSNGDTDATANNLASGPHSVIVTDANGCMETCTAQLSQPLAISIDLERDSVCVDFTQTITSSINGGTPPYIYRWGLLDAGMTGAVMSDLETPDMPSLDFNAFGLEPGTVLLGLTIEDRNGCIAFEQAPLDINCCFDLAVKKTVDNPFNYTPGDTVTFDIEVFNQGTVDAFNLRINDSSQAELLFDPSLNTAQITENQSDWILAKDPVFQTEINFIPAGSSHKLKVTLVVDQAFTGFELINYTEVVYYTNGIRELPPDEDDVPRRRISDETDDDIDDDSNGEVDNPMDEDRFDFEKIFLCSSSPYACNDNVNISLDENGEILITPDMVTEGLQSAAFVTVEVFDENDNSLGDLLTCAEIGKHLSYVVTNACDNSTCWGNLTIEDKMPPQVRCAIPDTFYCHETPSPLRPDTVSDNCGSWTMRVISDQMTKYPCDSFFSGKQEIVRVYEDPYGNVSEPCTKEIYFRRYHANDVVFPSDTIIPCLELVDADPETLGRPHVNGTPVYPMDESCSLALKFSDDTLYSCGNTFKIIRRWTAVDWCPIRGVDNPFFHIQVIKTIDQEDPVIYCPGTDLVVDTFPADENCTGTFILPEPHVLAPGQPIVDSSTIYIISECSDFTYTVEHVPADDPTNCTPANVQPSDDQIRKLANGRYEAFDLPFGCNWFYYIIEDDCGNKTTCTFDIFVEDKAPPVAVCASHTVVSLNLDGQARLYAEAVDDGSYDNCAIDTMLIRRMNGPACGQGVDLENYVLFCCEDIGDTIMVEFVVVDESGNSNSCMVEVAVQNKIAPVLISCPEDITIDCQLDYKDTSITNGGPLFEGVCDLVITYSDRENLDDCGLGTVTRTWRAEDASGQSASTCRQVITLIDLNPISDAVIDWPEPYVEMTNICDFTGDPDITGRPEITVVGCHEALMTYDDKNLVREKGSCFKVLRTWTVVDWCQFDLATGAGKWEFEQTIAIKNFQAPDVVCSDTTLFATDSCKVDAEIIAVGSDDCTDEQDLRWKIEVDIDNDGNSEIAVNSSSLDITLPLGTHKVIFEAKDGCGNSTTCEEIWEVKDGKNPSPVCKPGVVTVLMQNSGTISIWATDLNDKSFDNCTPDHELIFSFSSNISDDQRTFDCSDIENGISDTLELELWVTDEARNQDYCKTTIILQDNSNDVCPDQVTTVNLPGKVHLFNGQPIEETKVTCVHTGSGAKAEVMSVQDGSFEFDPVVPGQVYSFSAEKTDDLLNGVTTKDLVIMQWHLLGKQPFDQVHQFIAADVTNDGSISARDIVALRKVLLGKQSKFPNDQKSWRYMDESNSSDINDPFEFEENIELTIEEGLQIGFTGVKIGDVDGSYIPLNGLSTRSGNVLTFSWRRTDEGWQLIAEENIDLAGFQMSLNASDQMIDLSSESLDLTLQHWSHLDGELKISWSSNSHQLVSQGDLVFEMVLDQPTMEPPYLTEGLMAEAYDASLEAYDIALQFDEEGNAALQLYQNIPNPFDQSTAIPFHLSRDNNVSLSIFNAEGLLIHEVKGYYAKGDHQMMIRSDVLRSKGVMYYRMQVEHEAQIKKMIRL